MANRVFCLVETIARTVIKLTEPEYSRELLEMFPADLCQTTITDVNIKQIIAKINLFRHEKEDAFAWMIGLGFNWEDKPEGRKKLRELLSNSNDKLSSKQETLRREIKFLSNLNRSISELKFFKK